VFILPSKAKAPSTYWSYFAIK